MQQLTIELSEALAERLARLAAQQKKSVEQVALERLTPLLEAEPPLGSPAAIRQAMREPPHLSWEAVGELERAITEGALPVQPEGVFDEQVSR